MSILVNPQWMRSRIGSHHTPVILDVRWYRYRTGGYEDYLQHHIPNAIYVDMERDLTGPINPKHGRRPFPPRHQVQELVQRWGINEDSFVVVYDSEGGTAAARLWWILRNAGLKNVFFLDGGLDRWEAAGMPTLTGPGILPLRGNFTVSEEDCMPTISADDAANWTDHGILLDVRSERRYQGHFEYNDARLGHIPGALNLPTYGNYGPDKRFLNYESLLDRFEALGITNANEVAVYCGSGNLAPHTIAALEVAGLRGARLFRGGWSQWAMDPERPASRGLRP